MGEKSNLSDEGPKLWKYLLGAAVALAMIFSLWVALDLAILPPEASYRAEVTMGKLWWIGVPLAVVVLLFGGRWAVASHQMQERQAQAKLLEKEAEQQVAAARTKKGRREYVLEVIGLGVTLDKYRQGKLWEALQVGNAYSSIREQDPKKYPWSGRDKEGMSGARRGDALENGAWDSPDSWGVPVFNAQPPIHADPDSDLDPVAGIVSGAGSNGMVTHLFVVGPRRFEERPDRILEDVFTFFDANPDVPYVVLNSDDGATLRDMFSVTKKSHFENDGHFTPAMPDTATLFLLARRERVDAIRPFVFEDVDNDNSVEKLNQESVSRRLYLAYNKLTLSVPSSEVATNPEAKIGRPPLISEWLAEAAKFGVRHDIRGTGEISFLDSQFGAKHRPPLDWKPTPWFPVPWNKVQLADFDRLPTMGFIHRPVFVKMSDEHGKPLDRRDERRAALLAGWLEALQTLPEAERVKGPARIIAGTNNNTEQLLALEGVLHDYAAQGGPEIDTGKLDQFVNTDRRLGNTGAATVFMQIAIGVMGSYRAGGATAAINLRDPREASIIFISPPSDEKRKAQQNRDVFRHRTSLAIDPENYAVPSSEASVK